MLQQGLGASSASMTLTRQSAVSRAVSTLKTHASSRLRRQRVCSLVAAGPQPRERQLLTCSLRAEGWRGRAWSMWQLGWPWWGHHARYQRGWPGEEAGWAKPGVVLLAKHCCSRGSCLTSRRPGRLGVSLGGRGWAWHCLCWPVSSHPAGGVCRPVGGCVLRPWLRPATLQGCQRVTARPLPVRLRRVSESLVWPDNAASEAWQSCDRRRRRTCRS